MIKLVAVLCSIAAPFPCHEETVTTAISMTECTSAAIKFLPTWAEQRPAYELHGWKCLSGSKATERDA
jgi:hypothetical protein